jgi:hypothetical protein
MPVRGFKFWTNGKARVNNNPNTATNPALPLGAHLAILEGNSADSDIDDDETRSEAGSGLGLVVRRHRRE